MEEKSDRGEKGRLQAKFQHFQPHPVVQSWHTVWGAEVTKKKAVPSPQAFSDWLYPQEKVRLARYPTGNRNE